MFRMKTPRIRFGTGAKAAGFAVGRIRPIDTAPVARAFAIGQLAGGTDVAFCNAWKVGQGLMTLAALQRAARPLPRWRTV